MAYNLIKGDDNNNNLLGDTDPLNLDDEIRGFGGDDILKGRRGNNYLLGGKGNDILDHSNSNGKNILHGNEGDDYLKVYSSKGDNTLYGGKGDDSFSISSSQGDNTLYGGKGDDYLSSYYATGKNIFFGGEGDDFVRSVGSINDILNGGSGDDTFNVYEGTSTINGGIGNDLLIGGISAFGDYDYYYDYYSKAVVMKPSDAKGTSGTLTSGTTITSYTSIERFEVYGSNYNDQLVGGIGDDYFDSGIGNDYIYGAAGNDLIYTSGNSLIYGGVGDDFIVASGEKDYDYIFGQEGDDIILVYGVNGIVDGGIGNDTLSNSYLGYSQPVIMSFTNSERMSGQIVSGNKTLDLNSIEHFEINGSLYDDILLGGNNDDEIYASDGNDLVDGGAGNDNIDASDGNDLVDGGAGNDTLRVNIFHSFDEEFEPIVMRFSNPQKTIGSIVSGNNSINFSSIERFELEDSYYDDILKGGNGDDIIEISSGNDTIDSGGGNDYIYAEIGNDTVDGGLGKDTLSNNSYGNNLPDYFASVVINFSDSNKTSGSIVSGNNSLNFSSIEHFAITGSRYNDILKGGNGDDIFRTSSGNDTVDGSSGDDTVISSYSYGKNSVAISFSNAQKTSGTIVSGDTTISFNSIERFELEDSYSDDILKGGNGDDIFKISSGNDAVDGGSGNDTLSGGDTGFDFGYYIEHLFDESVVMSFSNSEETSGKIVSGDNSVNFSSIERFNIGSSTENDILLGSSGDDIIDPYDGEDLVDGGGGNDRISLYGLYFSTISESFLPTSDEINKDTLLYSKGDGTDTVDFFKTGSISDVISFTDIPYIDLVQNDRNTEIYLGDGVTNNGDFATGDLLMTLVDVTATNLTIINFENTDFFFS
jgi:Ca2+-binding RTX toxin-like protein